MKHAYPKWDRAAGFTLIELLVVIIIIGILAAVAVPQYFKVVERGRVVEAQSFIGSIKSAQERYVARYGQYASDLSGLDIGLTANCAAVEHPCGMKFFRFISCAANFVSGAGPYFNLVVRRCNTEAGCSAVPPATYGGYTMYYNRAWDKLNYTGCGTPAKDTPASECDKDF